MAIDDKKLQDAVTELHGQKKKFSQSYDLVVSLKDLNLKDPKDQVEFYALLPHGHNKRQKVCALVGPEMIDDAKAAADTAIQQIEFERLKKPDVRKLAREHDYFLGQANIMPKIAATFGRVSGPRGKMPNPKAGCIVPPKTPLKPLIDRLQKTVKVSAKKAPTFQIRIATQQNTPAQVLENVRSVYDQIVHNLPREENNVKMVWLKVTMSKPIKIK